MARKRYDDKDWPTGEVSAATPAPSLAPQPEAHQPEAVASETEFPVKPHSHAESLVRGRYSGPLRIELIGSVGFAGKRITATPQTPVVIAKLKLVGDATLAAVELGLVGRKCRIVPDDGK